MNPLDHLSSLRQNHLTLDTLILLQLDTLRFPSPLDTLITNLTRGTSVGLGDIQGLVEKDGQLRNEIFARVKAIVGLKYSYPIPFTVCPGCNGLGNQLCGPQPGQGN